AARIDRLAPEDKALLQAAAVIGKEIPWLLLSAVAGLGESELRSGLARLQHSELIVEGQLFPDLKYLFRHAITHEVAYEGLLQERRRSLHAQVLDAIERWRGHRLPEHVEALAFHALPSEQWDKAVMHLRRASETARARSAHIQAADHVQQALQAVTPLPNTVEWQRTSVDLRLELRHSLYITGDLERSIANLDLAERVAAALGDTRR